eukprot:TRINITY_DN18851_c0_g1_i1.p1 TRINITY_DN18851_c0_g1~~TRINITY_DN18851_c0_g1_i1.p1  ORF type:complete len:465 (+),score=80.01 TRINITY_DN18851_c0_g1_i1:80-1396(+)
MPVLPPPRAIYHAFHSKFAAVSRKVPSLARAGFDSIQISPAQRSAEGDEWYWRYQPVSYAHIEGLGSEADLCDLCAVAKDYNVIIIADCVFNHMVVVATSVEWRQAQTEADAGDSSYLEVLKQRLDKAVQGGGLDRNAFQWPWHPMFGLDWDNEHRFEGWGCGEWSELKDCPQTILAHYKHLKLLFDCGVRGFRFDAVKHMRPGHLLKYVDFLREMPEPVYFYGEVLSVERSMHEEYTREPLCMPSTDFILCQLLFKSLGERSTSLEMLQQMLHSATLGRGHVVFARNHDTVHNDEPVLGIDWCSAKALPAILFLLALPGHTVLMMPEDVQTSRRGLRFRALLDGEAAPDAKIEVLDGFLVVTRSLRNSTKIVGLAIINTTESTSDAFGDAGSALERLVEVCDENDVGEEEAYAETVLAKRRTITGRSARFFVCRSVV